MVIAVCALAIVSVVSVAAFARACACGAEWQKLYFTAKTLLVGSQEECRKAQAMCRELLER